VLNNVRAAVVPGSIACEGMCDAIDYSAAEAKPRCSAVFGSIYWRLKRLRQNRWELRRAVDIGGQEPPVLQVLTVQVGLHRRHIQPRSFPSEEKCSTDGCPTVFTMEGVR
jgi:hypothetical protein